MDKVTVIKIDSMDHVIIEHENGSFTTMLKSTYDELSAIETQAK
jgi:hypothetical protein